MASLNNAGQALGFVNGGAAFVWANGTSTIIPAAPGIQVIPADINNKGQVVGYYYPTAFATHAFSWQLGAAAIVDLGTLGGSNSLAIAVNDNGQITGTAALTGDTTSHAFRMTAGGPMKDLGSTFGATGNSTAVAINKGGAVTGQDAGGQGFHAFLYDTRLHDLGDLGGVDNQIWGINDLKDVVGWRLDPLTGPVGVVFPGGGAMTDLSPLAGQDSSQAFDINNAGQVVGNALMPDGQRRALLWDTR